MVWQGAAAAAADHGTTGFQSGFSRLGNGNIVFTNGSGVATPIDYVNPTVVGGVSIPAGTFNGLVDFQDNISTVTGVATGQIYWQPTLTQTVANTADTLQFGPSITPSELLFLHPAGSNDLLIGINDGNLNANATPGTFAELADQVRVVNYFALPGGGGLDRHRQVVRGRPAGPDAGWRRTGGQRDQHRHHPILHHNGRGAEHRARERGRRHAHRRCRQRHTLCRRRQQPAIR